jgi:hypothetical protein
MITLSAAKGYRGVIHFLPLTRDHTGDLFNEVFYFPAAPTPAAETSIAPILSPIKSCTPTRR